MLAVNRYNRKYVGECRSRIEALLAGWKAVAAAAGKNRMAVESFEPLFFSNLALTLDAHFVHRTRAIEGKDGNALNEVRMLCNSILHNHGVLASDKTIKCKPESSVLKLRVGDEIRIGEAQFRELLEAFFAEIERRFV